MPAPAPGIAAPAPAPAPAPGAPVPLAAPAVDPLAPPAPVSHLSSPENLPPGASLTPTGPQQSSGMSYLRELWHAVQTQEVSKADAVLLLTQRPMTANTPPPMGMPAGPQAPLPPAPAALPVDPMAAPAPAPVPPPPA